MNRVDYKCCLNIARRITQHLGDHGAMLARVGGKTFENDIDGASVVGIATLSAFAENPCNPTKQRCRQRHPNPRGADELDLIVLKRR